MYKNKKTGVIGIIVTVIILILIVIISNIKIEDFSHVGGALSSFVMPVQNGMTYIKNKIKEYYTWCTRRLAESLEEVARRLRGR